jgi:uncharacterized protein (DUF1778 family)
VVHVRPVVNQVGAALVGQASIAAGDAAIDGVVAQLVEGLDAVLRQAAFDLAQQAAAEVGAQLPDRTVEVVLADGDPMLRIGEPAAAPVDPAAVREDFDARITLRLPPSLKRLIEDTATVDGDSVNTRVVDVLARRARRPDTRGRRVTEGFDL